MKYHVQNNIVNVFYPEWATPGQYVVTTSGTLNGSVEIESADGTYTIGVLRSVSSVDKMPPKAQEVLESAPQTLAPPVGTAGYYYFVMPEEDVHVYVY